VRQRDGDFRQFGASSVSSRPRPSAVTNRQVFAIAGPAMLANLTTPLLGIVNTAAIGRLGEPHLIGGVALAAVVFDGIYWLFGFVAWAPWRSRRRRSAPAIFWSSAPSCRGRS
jgi:hypothetical protein